MWTVPNILTLGRIAAAPIVALMIALGGPGWSGVACVLFIAAALTDFLDGWLARRMNQISALGKMLDPIGDKVMVGLVLLALAAKTGGDWGFMVPAVVILTREFLVSGLREFLGDVKLNVTRLAKWKTTAQLTALAVLLLVDSFPPFHGGLNLLLIGLVLLWLAALLTAITGWDYFTRGIAHLREKEEA